MGEILFSIFIGSCLIFTGVLLNLYMYKEQKKFAPKVKNKK